jgi:nucleoside-diphosphate-sugar epimerase
MLLIRHQCSQSMKPSIVLLFGTGLIGSSITRGLQKRGKTYCQELSFDWSDYDQGKLDADTIFSRLVSMIDPNLTDSDSADAIAIVWSAGKAGFFASQEDIEHELDSYRIVLALLERVRQQFWRQNIAFHLLSSAGGLFENQSMVDETTAPLPKRFYGHLKYEQEKLLTQLDEAITKHIYRPTSVYGYSGLGQRMGLIPTLISNGIQNKTSTIFGSLSTLRDYVFNDDVGDHIAESIGSYNQSTGTIIQLLASGKPSAIFEIQHFVERVIRKKILLNFVTSPETDNATDIVVGSSGLPASWQPIDVKTGVQRVRDLMMAG